MRRCFDLAKKGHARVRTNPLVGSVIVFDNRIIGEGYHKYFGGPHAEIEALNSVRHEDKQYLTQATLYVNLAPCNHIGKTPACSEAILEAKIPTVVVAMTDEHQIAFGGIQRLKNAGTRVVENILTDEAKALNEAFLDGLRYSRPFVTLKWAESADGFIGRKEQQIQLSGKLSKLKVHELRNKHNAILVGSNTILTDDPQLSTREVPGDNPLRIALVGSQTLPSTTAILTDEDPVVIVSPFDSTYTSRKTIQHIHYHGSMIDIGDLLQVLYKDFNIGYLMVEGGAHVLQQFIDGEYWDEVWKFCTKEVLTHGIEAPKLNGYLQDKFTLQSDEIHLLKRP